MKTEFGVYLIQPLGSRVARVGVRVHSGSVHVGDCFVDARAALSAQHATEEALLEVTKIESFSLRSDTLDAGRTGYVMVRGAAVAGLLEGTLLRLAPAVAVLPSAEADAAA
jgi:hypothetical protein